jgi:hypothetical protein
MEFCNAITDDIPQMMAIRMSVKENRLSDPALVTADMLLTICVIAAVDVFTKKTG